MTPSLKLQSLLSEVERLVAKIKRAYYQTDDDIDVTTNALDCCNHIRKALASGDVSESALAGCKLGKLLEKLHSRGTIARYTRKPESAVDRAHKRDVQRRRAYFAEVGRGFSSAEAGRRAASKLKVSAKTIMRAVNGH